MKACMLFYHFSRSVAIFNQDDVHFDIDLPSIRQCSCEFEFRGPDEQALRWKIRCYVEQLERIWIR